MAYFFLVQFINTLDNPVVGIGQNDMVFLSGFLMNTSEALIRIGLNLIFQIIPFTSKGLLGKL